MKIKPQYSLLTLANTNNVNYDCSYKSRIMYNNDSAFCDYLDILSITAV